MARLRHLVVVIPGMGGSELEGDDGLAWGGSLALALQALADPQRLHVARPLRPVGLLQGFTLLPGWSVVRDYRDLVAAIRRGFDNVVLDEGHPDRPVPDANVLLFPYDFRRGVAETAARLDALVRSRLKQRAGADEPQVIVLAHSMGGLIARYWLGPLGASPLCRALLTLGTPHRGAPKALEWLVNGLPALADLRGATSVLRGWPSVYELLPRYRVVWDRVRAAASYPHELAGAWPIDAAAARSAFQLHADIEQAWSQMPAARAGLELVPLVGAGHPTLEWATWDGARLRVTKDPPRDVPAWLPDNGLRGDGTVPGIAAIPIELSDRPGAWRQSPQRHGAIASAQEVVQLLRQYSGASLGAVRGVAEARRPRLGVDLDECYAAGTPVPLRVELHGAEPAQGVEVWTEVAREDGRAVHARLRLERAGTAWAGEIAGLGSGLWRVRVATAGVEPAPAEVNDTVAVVGA